jgi:uncharacterized protein YgiM (DUF1202 family)
MSPIKKTASLILFLFILLNTPAFSQENKSVYNKPEVKPLIFQAKALEDGVNVRIDSTTSSQIICTLKKDDYVDVVSELYDWYKIRLPISAPAFIKKDLVEKVDERSAKVTGNNVNIRLHATTKAAILGKANNNEIVFISEDRGEWYKIYPTLNTFGWINKNLVTKSARPKIEATKSILSFEKTQAIKEEKKVPFSVEGILKTKTFTTVATHKILTKERKVYLVVAAPKVNLNPYNSKKVRISGKIISAPSEEPPLIEAEKIEALN